MDTLCINRAQDKFIYFSNSQQCLMHVKYQLKLNRIGFRSMHETACFDMLKVEHCSFLLLSVEIKIESNLFLKSSNPKYS